MGRLMGVDGAGGEVVVVVCGDICVVIFAW